MAFIDYYKILGLDKNASEKDIKSAYRKAARKYHPDLNPNDKEAHKRFQEINEAHEVLSDPEKRKKYDLYGENWKQGEEFDKARGQQQYQSYQGSGSQTFTDPDFGGDFSEFFSSMFGGASGRTGRQRAVFRGQDYNAELHLSLEDAFKTHQQTLNVNGKNIRITIPAGVENGQTIKIKGHGGPGVNGGPNGDLYITFIIANHYKFKRRGNDLYTIEDLDLYTAVLGGEITIGTMDSKVKLKIKPETQNGTKVKLKGKGFPVYKKEGRFGDLYVSFNIKIPTNLTEKQKELFRQLAES